MRRLRVSRAIALGALALVAGCSNAYYAQIDGDVRGTDVATPRAVRPGIYDDAAALRTVPTAAGPHLRAVPEGRVTIGLRFGDEHRDRHSETVTIDSATAQFHYTARGESRERISAVSIRVDAPGWEPLEQVFTVERDGKIRLHVLAVLDRFGAPPAPAATTPSSSAESLEPPDRRSDPGR